MMQFIEGEGDNEDKGESDGEGGYRGDEGRKIRGRREGEEKASALFH